MEHQWEQMARPRLQTAALGLLIALVLLCFCLFLTGCYDVATWQARTFYGLDCRSEKLQNGQCVPVKKGDPNAKTAQP